MPNVTVGTDTCWAGSTLERIPPRSSEFNTAPCGAPLALNRGLTCHWSYRRRTYCSRQPRALPPRPPISGAGRSACRMRLAALAIAFAGAGPKLGRGKGPLDAGSGRRCQW
jgi:hypothetical protein